MDQANILAVCPQCARRSAVALDIQHAGSLQCQHCHHVFLMYKPISGFIYVLSNDHIPGLVKVGLSHRPVEERVGELNAATGVPAPFEIEAYFLSGDPEGHERQIHQKLNEHRIPGREFFRCDVQDAIAAIERVCGNGPIFLAEKWRGARGNSAAAQGRSRQSNSLACPHCNNELSANCEPNRYIGICSICRKWIDTG